MRKRALFAIWTPPRVAAFAIVAAACGSGSPSASPGSGDAGPDGGGSADGSTPADAAHDGASAVVDGGSEAGATSVLGPSDFTYLGYYKVDTSLSVGWNVVYAQGLTFRRVNGQLRFMSLFYPDTGKPLVLLEFTLPSAYEKPVVQTNRWSDIFAGGSIPNQNGLFYGLWSEAPKQRLWTTAGIDYPDLATQGSDTASVQVRTLNDDGSIENLQGPWGLAGITARAIMGGVVALPSSFQSAYGVGPYAIGFGGCASLLCQTVSPAVLGPTLFAIPEPTTHPSGSLPFTRLLDFTGGSCVPAWYPEAGAPKSFDRGVRNADVATRYDTWVSPAPDGLGRWTWGDSDYQTGVWIEGPNKHGFVIVPSFATGNAYYQTSTLNCDGRNYEIQVFDPSTLGQVAKAATPSWDVKPASRWVVSFPGFGAGMQGDGQVGNMAAAAFDPSTNLFYVFGVGVNGATQAAGEDRIFVFHVSD